MSGLLTEMIQLLTGGLSAMATGIGTGLKNMVEAIFVTVTPGTGGAAATYELTTFGGLILIFAAIALAVGLSRYIVNWVTSLGN